MNFEVRNGIFRYKKEEREILRGVDFSVGSGEVVAVLGPNGAGKTTLLRCALGFLKFTDGYSELDGKRICDYKPKELWKKVAYVPQARNSVSPYTVEETLLLGRNSYGDFFGKMTDKDYEAVEGVIEKLGLDGIRKKNCREISGGELQMVLIGRALAAEPELLVLDEPESNLDFRNQLLVLDTISTLAEEGAGIIMNTHYPAHALRRADKALLLGRDGFSEFGASQKIINPTTIGKYFGVNAVIGEIENENGHYADVVPVGMGFSEGTPDDCETVATVSVILSDNSKASEVNAVIRGISGFVVGRMGMPVREKGLSVINLVLVAPAGEIRAFIRELGRKKGVSVKAVFDGGGK